MQVRDHRLRLRAADARANGVGEALQRCIDISDVDAVELVHRDGGCAVDERIGRFDLPDLPRQQVERFRCTAKGEGGFHDFVAPSIHDGIRSDGSSGIAERR
jgi:hypothetical protein